MVKDSKVVSANGNVEWNVARNPEWDEYVVRVKNVASGRYDKDLSYHTDDLQDAFGTRDAMKRNYDRTHPENPVSTLSDEMWDWKDTAQGRDEIPEGAKSRSERTHAFMELAKSKGRMEFYYLHALLCCNLGWASDFYTTICLPGGQKFGPSDAINAIFDFSMIAKRMDELNGYTKT